jgi:hypothetical protein
MFVSLKFDPALGCSYMLFDQCNMQLPFCEQVLDRLVFSSTQHRRRSYSRIITMESLEWRAAQRRVEGSIIPVLSKRQPRLPLLRGVMNTTSEEHFKTLVDPLGLTICLWGVGCAG